MIEIVFSGRAHKLIIQFNESVLETHTQVSLYRPNRLYIEIYVYEHIYLFPCIIYKQYI